MVTRCVYFVLLLLVALVSLLALLLEQFSVKMESEEGKQIIRRTVINLFHLLVAR